MTALLPPNLLRLFAPRPHPPFLLPLTKDERDRGPNALKGVGDLVKRIREDAENEEVRRGMEERAATIAEANGTAMPKAEAEQDKVVGDGDKMDVDVKVENGEVEEGEAIKKKDKGKKVRRDPIAEAGVVGQEARKMRKELRKKRQEQYKKDSEENYQPQNDENAVGDPYKTLFIARLSKKTTEADLRHEFEMYGAIERVRMVKNRKGKPTSYAFIVFERERDMKGESNYIYTADILAAYKDAEGIPIHHKRILVDVERGRTVKGWRPRKLGGGLGGRPVKLPPAEAPPMPMMDGGRGGFRGRGGPFRGGPSRGFVPRGGFMGRGGFGGGDRGGFGGDRGGFGAPRGGGFSRGGMGGDRGGFGGPPGGDRGYGGQGPPGGFGGPPGNGFAPQGNGFGGGPGGGFKRDFQGGGGPGFGGGGGPGGGMPYGGGGGGGGYEDRDSKRARY